ncbi:MAG: ABC transporter ATP-binding protein [Firmicutes bacterium HGW-Firmicutes-19]|nr:MAG: ABC transporter ATP-binding protein [Firmicutes bacterium HGW-Firmicutes-19]
MSERFEEQEYNTDSLDTKLWSKILKLLWIHKKDLFVLYGFMIMLAFVDVSFPLLNRHAIDNFVIGNAKENEVLIFALVYLGFVVWQSFNVYYFIKRAGKIEMNFAYDVRQKAFTKLQELSFNYYDKTPLGWIMARMTSDITRLSEILSWGLMDMVWGFSVMFGITIVMLITNWKLAMLILMVIPVLWYISVYFQTRILKTYRDVRKVNSKITGAFSEGISGAKTTKTMAIEDLNLDEFKTLTGEMRQRSIKAAVLSALFMPLVTGLGAISTAGILVVGGQQVLLGAIQFGTLMLFTQYAAQFFEPLRQIARLLAELQMAQASAERVLSLMNSEAQIVDHPHVIERFGTILQPKTENYPKMDGEVEFRNVTFYYNPQEPVLTDFNLKVQRGQTVALVGETGSGKSTIVNLLCRFYQPVEGSILIDGVDITERSIGWLHSNLGYVLQAPHLFSGTVAENIRYGRLDATDEEVEDSAKMVNAHNFITKLEQGYLSDVGEGGSRLSTGEKQLISFARAVLADPAIFVLDEATSSIDTETEQIIQHAIDTLLVNRTSFVIAHRLSTIVSADVILVIKKGKIVEQGTHQELLRLKGSYYRLYTNQFQEDLQNQLLQLKPE